MEDETLEKMEDKTTKKDMTKFFVAFLKEFEIYSKILSNQTYRDSYNRVFKLFLRCNNSGKYHVLTRLFRMTISAFNSDGVVEKERKMEQGIAFNDEEAEIYDILYKIYLLKNIQIMPQLNIDTIAYDPSPYLVNQIKDMISSPIIILQSDLTDKLVEVMETESELLLKNGIRPLTKNNFIPKRERWDKAIT